MSVSMSVSLLHTCVLGCLYVSTCMHFMWEMSTTHAPTPTRSRGVVYICKHIYTYCMPLYICIYICTYTYLYSYTYMYIYVCICIYTHIDIHIYTYMYTLNNAEQKRSVIGYQLQHTATHCNTLQHTATHSNTQQNTEQRRTKKICSFIHIYDMAH